MPGTKIDPWPAVYLYLNVGDRFPPGAAHPVFYGDGLVRDLCAVSRGKDAHHRGQDAAIVPRDAILQRITQIDGGFRYFYRIDILEK